MRSPSTDVSGHPFEGTTIKAVWVKGRSIEGFDSKVWRHDKYGHVMKYEAYGDTNAKFGWEVDHILPVAKGSTDDLMNLQPLYWETNRRKGNTYPWNCN